MVLTMNRQPTTNNRQPTTDPRSGIALVATLGLLAVLVLLAVSFAITMRTERLAASMQVRHAETREAIYVGVSRALDDIDFKLKDPTLLFFPPSILCSDDQTPGQKGGACDILWDNDVAQFFPAATWTDAQNANNASVKWVYFGDEGADPSTVNANDAIGRYAFLAVDCSGFIDANYVSFSPQTNGINVDLDANKLNGVLTDYPVEVSFDTLKTELRRFEDVRELNSADILTGGDSVDFVTYSRFPINMVYEGGNNFRLPVYVGGVLASLQAQASAIADAFEAAGIDPAVSADVVYNLFDYVDDDSIPNQPDSATALASFNTEPVPMINEIVVTNTLYACQDAGGTNYFQHEATVIVELWNPFPNAGTFSIDTSPGSYDIDFSSPLGPLAANYLPTHGSFTFASSGPLTFSGNDVQVARLVFTGEKYKGPPLAPQVPPFTLNTEVKKLTLVDGSGNVVDLVDASAKTIQTKTYVMLTYPAGPDTCNKIAAVPSSIACKDPRFNFNSDGWESATSPSFNPPEPNNGLLPVVGEGFQPYWFVRNSALSNAAELGYLCSGEPNETIALYETKDNRFNPVLDFLSTDPRLLEPATATNRIRKGQININTQDEDVLAGVFKDIDTYDQPGVLLGAPVLSADAQTIADGILPLTAQGTNWSVASMGLAPQFNLWANDPSWTDARIESVIAQSHEWFGYRQNLFQVLVVVQRIEGGEVLGEQRAILQVWRDPAPVATDAAGNPVSPLYLRSFRWLDPDSGCS